MDDRRTGDIKDRLVPISLGLAATIVIFSITFGWYSRAELGDIQEKIVTLKGELNFLEKRVDLLYNKTSEIDQQVNALKIQGATTGQGWLELKRRVDNLEKRNDNSR